MVSISSKGGIVKKHFYILFIAILLTSCGPSDQQIQAALEQTHQAQPIQTSIPEPTSTPEYCPLDEAEAALDKLYVFHDDFANEFNRGLDDYHFHQEVVVEITKIKNDLDKYSVPLCLEYDKELLATAMQNSIDAFKDNMAGSQVGYQDNLVEARVNLDLFYAEHDRIADCVPNCD